MRRATTRRGSVSTLPASRRAAKPAGSLKRLQRIAQALVLDRQRVAQLRSRQHHALDQKSQHSPLETASLTVSVLELGDDLQVGRLGVSRDQFQMDRRPCWRRAVLAGKHQVFPDSPEIQGRVAEGMNIPGAAQSLTGGNSSRGIRSPVMHQQDRQVELPM
jgi:hypothetical protein